jgi:hypothetical protein
MPFPRSTGRHLAGERRRLEELVHEDDDNAEAKLREKLERRRLRASTPLGDVESEETRGPEMPIELAPGNQRRLVSDHWANADGASPAFAGKLTSIRGSSSSSKTGSSRIKSKKKSKRRREESFEDATPPVDTPVVEEQASSATGDAEVVE